MGTQDARRLAKTARWVAGDSPDELSEDGVIVFDPVVRSQPEPGYWLELAFPAGESDWLIGNKLAGRLGPLSGALSGSEPVSLWKKFRYQALGIAKAMLGSRPDILEHVTDEELRNRLKVIHWDEVPAWPMLIVAANELVRSDVVVLSALSPTGFDAPTAKGKVLAYGLNEAMKANGIAACKLCGTVFVTSARPRDYCTPACRKEHSVKQKLEQE